MAKKGGKKGKGMVISKVKRANHLKQKKNPKGVDKSRIVKKNPSKIYQHVDKSKSKIKGKGQDKGTPNVSKKKVVEPKKAPPKSNGVVEDVFEADEMMDMMDDEDLQYLAKASSAATDNNGENQRKRKRKNIDDDDNIEEEYDEEMNRQRKDLKMTRPLLPIKTKEGIVERSMELEDQPESEEEQEDGGEQEAAEEEQPKSVAEIYAQRQKKIEELKCTLGVTSSNIIENPEERMDSISAILKLYSNLTPDIYITGCKLISASLVELFKDLAPGFEIKQTAKAGDKLKKETRVVYGNEGRLLKFYQIFLKKLETMFSPLKEGRKGAKDISEAKKRVAFFSLQCMANLMTSMPHFNFAKNIVHSLIPFTGHKDEQVREHICSSFRKLFKEDRKGEVSLHAVRQINHLIKNKRQHQIPPSCLEILLALRIKDVNLDKEKEEEISRYKTLTRKQKLLVLSKNERRRRKKIERLEKEIVAAKAETNKESKVKFQTETVKLVFAIYFRILKMAPKSALMGVVLQGLAKFAHTINVEFFTDLVEVFNSLINGQQLDHRQSLFAIQVVLTMLSGHGEALNIDPLYFYAHLYNILFQLTAGPSNNDVPVALDCLDNMLIKRKKKVSIHRVLAFAKRIATLAMQVQHNSCAALLNFVRLLMMTHKQTDMLLDLDCTSGNGSFLPELEEPEHCNAGSTALWELHSLTRHYHPVVGKLARHLLLKCPNTGNGVLPLDMSRKTPLEYHTQYDASTLAFNPAVQVPSNASLNWKKLAPEGYHSKELEAIILQTMNTDEDILKMDFFQQFQVV